MKKEEQEVVKTRVSYVRILIALLILYIIGFNMYKFIMLPINNIYIEGNNHLQDQEIIDISGIRNYPSFILTTKYNIRKKLLKNEFIKSVKVNKKMGRILEIIVEENTPLFIYDNKTILSNNKYLDDTNYELPTLSGNLNEDIISKLVEKYQNIDEEVANMISEIKYDPNNIDKERFLLTMNDGNYVYITLYKITAVNEYIKIVSKTSSRKGIFYLDSGNYFEEL